MLSRSLFLHFASCLLLITSCCESVVGCIHCNLELLYSVQLLTPPTTTPTKRKMSASYPLYHSSSSSSHLQNSTPESRKCLKKSLLGHFNLMPPQVFEELNLDGTKYNEIQAMN